MDILVSNHPTKLLLFRKVEYSIHLNVELLMIPLFYG